MVMVRLCLMEARDLVLQQVGLVVALHYISQTSPLSQELSLLLVGAGLHVEQLGLFSSENMSLDCPLILRS